MKFFLALLALAASAALAQTVQVPPQTITVPVPAQTIAVPAKTVSITVPASTITIPASTLQYTVPGYTLTIPPGGTPPTPSVTLSASPTSIAAGSSSTVTWTSTNATSCTGVGTALSGSASVSPTATTTYSETCGGVSASATVTVTAVVTPPPVASNCGNVLGSAVTFCDTFDVPAGIGNGNRSGDLNGNVWGVSRAIGGGVNFGQNAYDQWNATTIQKCDGTTPTVTPPNDIIICNGQLREASNDNNTLVFDAGDVTLLAMYPKQPFDFANRTGTVSFDVSNDSEGIHAAWPEFWVTDAPVPAPLAFQGGWISYPANAFGIRMAASAQAGDAGTCPNLNNLSKVRWTLDSAVVIRNYIAEDVNYASAIDFGTASNPPLHLTTTDCVIAPALGSGVTNHVEVRVSHGEIDVYATDAGVIPTATSLRKIASITNANLSFTRGLIWLMDVHYNADKMTLALPAGTPSQRQHTFVWDNAAFDGPFTDRDFSYDAPNNTVAGPNGSVNLGKFSLANQQSSWPVTLPTNPGALAAAAKVLFSFNAGVGNPNPTTLNVTVNGHAHPTAWPYPDSQTSTWRTFAVQVPLTDLVSGANVVQLGSTVAVVFANVDIVLADVTGGIPVLPGANDAYP